MTHAKTCWQIAIETLSYNDERVFIFPRVREFPMRFASIRVNRSCNNIVLAAFILRLLVSQWNTYVTCRETGSLRR